MNRYKKAEISSAHFKELMSMNFVVKFDEREANKSLYDIRATGKEPSSLLQKFNPDPSSD